MAEICEVVSLRATQVQYPVFSGGRCLCACLLGPQHEQLAPRHSCALCRGT
jgi:hypothetical protein